jgi:hypothetical protein
MKTATKVKIIGGGLFGLIVGYVLMSSQAVRILALAGTMSLPVGIGTAVICDRNAQNQLKAKDDKLIAARKEASQIPLLRAKVASADEASKRLYDELAKLRKALEEEKSDRLYTENQLSQSRQDVENRKWQIGKLEESLGESQDHLDSALEELEQWEQGFNQRLEKAVSERVAEIRDGELDAIFDEHDRITQEAIAIAQGYQQIKDHYTQRFQEKTEFIRELVHKFNEPLTAKDEQIEGYLQQIEALNGKIALLQQELAGDLIEPEYFPVAYDIDGRIANDIARKIWEECQIPLAVRGYHKRSDGTVDIGLGYSRSIPVEALTRDLQRFSVNIAKGLGLHKITSVRKLEYADLLVLSFRREPAIKDSDIGLIVGSADEFINYITSHPIRYRIIADPGQGKTPTTAVMLSEILKAGTRRGNTAKGAKVEHTLVTVSYPGVQSSLKDSDYPLETFLQYGTETAAIKSFQVALEDWKYRKQNVPYAEKFFQLWVWDELDNTLNSASAPKTVAENFKTVLKQGGHNNIGWIASGQSVMTKQIPGFMNDDRSLFTEIVIGIPKIRLYLNTYGKGKNSESNLAKLSKNLDEIEAYVEHKNQLITDDARLLRVALIVDSRSPKLYFLPNLDRVDFDYEAIENTRQLARDFRGGETGEAKIPTFPSEPCKTDTESVPATLPQWEKSPIQGQGSLPHCPECGSANLTPQSRNRWKCEDCKARRTQSKIVWK